MLEGIDSSTSATIQVCKSYKFQDLEYSADWKDTISVSATGRRLIDFHNFQETYRVYTPLCWTPAEQEDNNQVIKKVDC